MFYNLYLKSINTASYRHHLPLGCPWLLFGYILDSGRTLVLTRLANFELPDQFSPTSRCFARLPVNWLVIPSLYMTYNSLHQSESKPGTIATYGQSFLHTKFIAVAKCTRCSEWESKQEDQKVSSWTNRRYHQRQKSDFYFDKSKLDRL